MNDPLCKYMKVGLVHFMAYPTTIKGEGPILETIKKLALDDYFTAIEITTIKNIEERQKVKQMKMSMIKLCLTVNLKSSDSLPTR